MEKLVAGKRRLTVPKSQPALIQKSLAGANLTSIGESRRGGYHPAGGSRWGTHGSRRWVNRRGTRKMRLGLRMGLRIEVCGRWVVPGCGKSRWDTGRREVRMVGHRMGLRIEVCVWWVGPGCGKSGWNTGRREVRIVGHRMGLRIEVCVWWVGPSWGKSGWDTGREARMVGHRNVGRPDDLGWGLVGKGC